MRRYHVLILGVVLSLTPQAMSEEGLSPAEKRAAAQANQRAEQVVNRQLGAIQQRLAQEEKRIEKRLQQLAQQREAALKKEDSAALDRIEKLEKRAISDYDAQINRIIKSSEQQLANAQEGQSRRGSGRSVRSVPQPPQPPQAQRRNQSRSNNSRNGDSAEEGSDSDSDRRSPRRRFRLWPF